MMREHTKWFHASFEDSGHWSGGYETREDAIDAGRADHGQDEEFFITEARNSPLRLADWINADGVFDRATDALQDSDRVNYEYDDDFVFRAKPDQEGDLIARLKRACDEWQAEHGIVFKVRTFEDMGRPERIAALTPAQPPNPTEGDDK